MKNDRKVAKTGTSLVAKIGRIGFAKLSEFDGIDYFITEKGLDKSFDAIFKEAKVKVIEV